MPFSKEFLPVKINRAKPTDANDISCLLKSLSHYFITDPAQAERFFLPGFEPEALLNLINGDYFHYWVARINNELAGVVAVKNKCHLYHLCIGESFQKQGLGRALWQHAYRLLTNTWDIKQWTVNASIPSIPFYQGLGFEPMEEITHLFGIGFLPMRLRVPI